MGPPVVASPTRAAAGGPHLPAAAVPPFRPSPPAVTGAPITSAARAIASGRRRLTRRGSLPMLDHAVDDLVLLRLFRAHEVVALGVLGRLVERLSGVFRDDLVEPAAHIDDLL